MSLDEGIKEFWRWWATARDRIVDAIEVKRHFEPELVDEISRHVDGIGDLQWELAPGKTANHAFCLSANGDPADRLITELWRARGPEPDEVWEYHAARQPFERTMIVYEGVELALADLVAAFTVDPNREVVEATFFHPSLALLPEATRESPVFLMLDGLFGEDAVQRWFDQVDVADQADASFKSVDDLQAAVAELARTATGQRWSTATLPSEDGGKTIALVNRAVKRIDHLLCCMHVAIDLALLDVNERHLPTKDERERLDAVEDELADQLASTVVYIGRETRAGHRVMHWYAPEDSAAQAIIERWAIRHRDRNPQVEWIRDPRWEFAKRYR